MLKSDLRLDVYNYWNQLTKYLNEDVAKIFNEKMIYPRQLEIHLPANHQIHCNFSCFYCAGKKFIKDLALFEIDALALLQNLNGNIPYIIYGGSYTEPILNPHLMTFLNVTKRTGAHFGIHTNGSLLKRLEKEQGWITELCGIAEDKVDYLSISVDAGSTESHCKTKNLKYDWFNEILDGISMVCKIRGDKPAVRICYLMNNFNSSQEEINKVVKFVKDVGADSLRFSIPFYSYGHKFEIVRKYKRDVEQKYQFPYLEKIKKHLSKNKLEKPFIFWISPRFQDIELFDFQQCAYGYYQICCGADGYVYRCTTISAPNFKNLRLGKLTSDLQSFKNMILANQNPLFDCNKCFIQGARCNRMGLEINRAYRTYKGDLQ